MAPKITLVGAGSVVFAKNLLGDILRFPELASARLTLMDVDPTRLRVAQVMAERMVRKLGVGARVEATLDRREAVRGAHHVICTVQVGGYEPGTVLDFEIPRRHGLRQTIGDTLGVGGVFRALRTAPVLLGLARDIAEVGAPGCLLLNYTNPMAMLCWALDRAVGIPCVGLCHSVQGTAQQLAAYAQLPADEVRYLVAGINHMAFFLRFEYRGQDAYPLLFRLLEDPTFREDQVRFEMMRRTGYFVTESSEHQSEYVPYFIHHGPGMIERFGVPLDEYLRRCETIMATWKATEAELLGHDENDFVLAPRSHEYGSYLIHSRETNTPRVIYGNVPNRGLIANLPAGCCVEVPCLVDAQGVQPTAVGALPPQLAALCQTNVNVQALAVEAALTGKREHIYHAVMLDPHTAASLPLDSIWAMCDELIEAHQRVGLLGEFSATLPGTGRAYAGIGDRVHASLEPTPDGDVGPGTDDGEEAAAVGLRIVVTNPREEPAEVPLTLRVEPAGAAGDIEPAAGFTLTVPPRGRLTRPVSVRRQPAGGPPSRPAAEGFEVVLESPSPAVLARGWRVVPRRVFTLPGREADPVPRPDEPGFEALPEVAFTGELGGVPAVRGALAFLTTTPRPAMELRLEVRDSRVRASVDGQQPGAGSCVHLLFASEEDPSVVRGVYCVPLPDALPPGSVQVMDAELAPLRAVRAAYREHGSGSYFLRAVLPLESVGLPPTTRSFLFDLVVTLEALGEAHSGGQVALSQHPEAIRASTHFARVRLPSAPARVEPTLTPGPGLAPIADGAAAAAGSSNHRQTDPGPSSAPVHGDHPPAWKR